MKIEFIITALIFLLISCKDMGGDLLSEVEQDNLRESVYRYQLKGADTSKIYFLTIVKLDSASGKYVRVDPNDSFIYRFNDLSYKIKKLSDSDFSQGWVVDKSTGKKGIILKTESIHLLSTTEAQIYGGYEENGLSGAGIRYRVQYLSGKWEVVESIVTSIS